MNLIKVLIIGWRRIRGRRRLRWGYCPLCNSSPPRVECAVCRGNRDYGPDLELHTRLKWIVRWNRWIDDAAGRRRR